MADNGPWNLTITFTGVSDGAASLGDILNSNINASGPNQQVFDRLVVTGTALVAMFRDGDPAVLLKLAKKRNGRTAIRFQRPPAQSDE